MWANTVCPGASASCRAERWLTIDDYVAFPYGRDVKPGAPTVEATADQLYSGM